jgi:hypothetical protein
VVADCRGLTVPYGRWIRIEQGEGGEGVGPSRGGRIALVKVREHADHGRVGRTRPDARQPDRGLPHEGIRFRQTPRQQRKFGQDRRAPRPPRDSGAGAPHTAYRTRIISGTSPAGP